MKKLLSGLIFLNVLAFGPVQAHANDTDPLLTQGEFAARAHRAEQIAERVKRVSLYQTKIDKLHFNGDQWQRRGPTVNVPELDASAASAALALLIGGAFVLLDRKKRIHA